MNNLYIFGDSFSTNFTSTNEVEINESWPVLLSKKLNLNLINHAIIGACNGEIINKFFEKYENIKKDDIVIFEIGFYNRVLDPFQNTTIAIGYDDRFIKVEMDFFEYKSLDMDEYIRQDLRKMEFIFNYLKTIGVKFYIWCIDRDLDPIKEKYGFSHFEFVTRKFPDNVIQYNNQYWCSDGDKHFNKLGHLEFFQYLYPYIQ
jgi:hypothetical protein